MRFEFAKDTYEKTILDYPKIALALLLAATVFFASFIPQFRLDASSDSLLLEGDDSIKYYRQVAEQYGDDDFLIVTYTPNEDLFDASTLNDLALLKNELARIDHIQSVTSILEVPLVNTPPADAENLKDGVVYNLTHPEVDIPKAKTELTTSPLYRDLIISKDGKTTAILLHLKESKNKRALLKERTRLREKDANGALSREEEKRLEKVEEQYADLSAKLQKQQQQTISDVRETILRHKDRAEIYLGGVPMITADSIAFVKKDLETFGFAVLAFIILLLTLFFRSFRWVALPIINAAFVSVIMFGFLGFVEWPITVVSSNFISLLLIFTLSFSVHQIVRYLEYQRDHSDADQKELVTQSTLKIITPCFFMVVTTMIAFGSLVVSGIRPVIDFGWIMTVGLGISFIVSFILFPCVLLHLKPVSPKTKRDVTGHITQFFANLVENYGKLILVVYGVVVALGLWGLTMLTVENRFIDYYKEHTEIYQSMETIDTRLGGTTPLDIVIDAPKSFMDEYRADRAAFMERKREENPNFEYEPNLINGYWIIEPRDEMREIHEHLKSLEETGKVLSFYTTMEMAYLIDPQATNTIVLATVEDDLPPFARKTLFDSYISEDGNQARFSARIYESSEGLKRNDLLNNIKDYIVNTVGVSEDRVHMTGMLVLYNNVLQSLFDSQIKTVWTIFITIFAVFVILFRNIFTAGIAVLPNVTITITVLGLMGWLGIPLDIMTITIAAICTGSADDNTIHYVHRFKTEYQKHGDYWKAMHASHKSIGRAMYYTSVTIMLGFSILTLSNFVPTVYFGLLTSFAMLMALLANLVLLPLLLVMFKPFKETAK